MWCSRCQDDVAVEASGASHRVNCAVCGCELIAPHQANPVPIQTDQANETQDARQLLERWSSAEILDPFGPTPIANQQLNRDDASQGQLQPVPRKPHSAKSSKPKFRIDQSHSQFEKSVPTQAEETQTPDIPIQNEVHQQNSPAKASENQQHANPVFYQPPIDINPNPQSRNWQTLLGQILAYLGVGGLGVGTSLVLWGYFGGPPQMTPNGWLLTTAGQMLLFLGVVTLIAGGLEQTTNEVSQKIDSLSERLFQFENRYYRIDHPETLKGPHFFGDHSRSKQSGSESESDFSAR